MNSISLTELIIQDQGRHVTKQIIALFPHTTTNYATKTGLIVRTTPANLRAIAIFLRNYSPFQLSTLADIAVVDRLEQKNRFTVKYLFLSTKTNQRATVKLFVNETSAIPSLAAPFFNAKQFFASAG